MVFVNLVVRYTSTRVGAAVWSDASCAWPTLVVAARDADDTDDDDTDEAILTHSRDMFAGIVAVAVGAPALAKAALACVGFTKVGIAAGSLAATVQSVVYGGLVPAGGAFALLQSSAMTFSVVKASAMAVGSYACWLVGARARG